MTRPFVLGSSRLALFVLSLAPVAAPAMDSIPDGSCNADKPVSPVCRFANPEDLVAAPWPNTIIVSEFGGMEANAAGGRLVAWTVTDETITPLFPAPGAQELATTAVWGASTCTMPPRRFSPHGIDLIQRADGTWMLFVVNHGDREAIELFAVDATRPTVAWRGCVEAPPGQVHNDVAGRPDGSFYATNPFALGPSAPPLQVVTSRLLGRPTGYVGHWTRSRGYRALGWTDSGFPNGIAVSPDGRTLFVNGYWERAVIRFDIAQQKRTGKVEIPYPDNLTWTPQGTLLAASQDASILTMSACLELTTAPGTCPAPLVVTEVHPETLAAREVLRYEGPAFGGATVALETQLGLFLGTAFGNRIGWVEQTGR